MSSNANRQHRYLNLRNLLLPGLWVWKLSCLCRFQAWEANLFQNWRKHLHVFRKCQGRPACTRLEDKSPFWLYPLRWSHSLAWSSRNQHSRWNHLAWGVTHTMAWCRDPSASSPKIATYLSKVFHKFKLTSGLEKSSKGSSNTPPGWSTKDIGHIKAIYLFGPRKRT